MKALVLTDNARLEYLEVEMPEKTSPSDLLVRIQAAGICGSDLPRAFAGGAYHYPLIMGHEMAGTVAEAPAGAAFSPGDRVAVFPLLPCYSCGPCSTGDYAQCRDYDYYGSRRHGGFAEYLYVPESNLFPVPDTVDIAHAAMTEPCAVALHAVRRCDVKAGSTGAVIGGGPIGNMAAQWLAVSGCSTVIVCDIDERKLETAAEMGFVTCDSSRCDPVEFIGAHTDGDGADVSIEAVGLPHTFLQAVQAAGRHAQVVFMGNIKGDLVIPDKEVSRILRKELTIRGTWNSKPVPRGRDDWTASLAMMGDRILIEPLVSHRPPLHEGPEIFDRLRARNEYFSKVIFEIGS